MALYDRIGRSYAQHRVAEPAIEARIARAIGDAGSVVNVGAGAGSYEPRSGLVVAVEPSPVMIAQRPPDAAPVVSAFAAALPFPDGRFDVSMAVMSVHHWDDPVAGLLEMRRVGRRCVVLAFDAPVLAEQLWLIRDYLPEAIDQDIEVPDSVRVAELVSAATIEPVPIPSACVDGFLPAYWARPEAYLDPAVRSAISVFHRISPRAVQRMVMRLSDDLADGTWERRYGDLRRRDELDVGFRLIA